MASAPSSPAGGGLRVLFVTLEFRAGAFSGNGVYAQSQARALAKAGHEVHVVSGVPSNSLERKQSRRTHYPGDPPNLVVTEILLSEDHKWGRLDAECGWREFAERAGPGLEEDLVRGIADFDPDVILGVDWSSLPAARSLSRRVRSLKRREGTADEDTLCDNASAHLIAPFVYSNFRVFTRSAPEAHAKLEADAVAAARGVLVLCREDADFVAERLSPPGIAVAPRVVLPPLREDVRALAESPAESTSADAVSVSERKYLTCCVRLSPEKEPENFLRLCRWLAARDALRSASLVPVLCASTRGEYAASVRSRFQECVRGNEHRIVTEHLDAKGLRDLFRATRLNYHPCRKDAYGMTVVEAGAFGAPSVAQRGGGVGATHTLREKDGASLGMDLRMTERSELSGSDDADDDETAHAEVLKHALDAATLARVGAAARRAATAWDEAANADAVARALRDAIDAHRRGDALGDRRWRLPSREDAERLRPLWRDATLGVWSGGEWVVLQHAAACGETPHLENSPEWRLGRGGARTTTTRVVVVTAHNPMGAPRDAAANDAATRTLLNEARALHEDGVFEDVRPCVSVDAVGGAAAWCEPGLALTLAETSGSNEQAFVAAARLARSHGQAAVYELTGTRGTSGKWTLAVTPVFPGLDGLAVLDAPLVVRQPPRSMPTDPREAGCFWDGETAVLGLQ
jgi:glycosyltransferase involved in cell wall biosynthesis